MKIYESSVKKPITTALIFVAVVVLGLFSFSKLSIDMLPEIEMNQAIVMVNYPGASAEDVENNITKPLENVLSTVSELKKIRSTSKDNISIINIEFNWGVDLDEKSNDIRDKIEFVKQALPDGSSNPMILKFSTDMIPVMFISATSEESTNGLYKLLEDGVANPLNRINGVGTVSIAGAPKREISVNVDPKKLEAYNLTIEQIGQKIGLENLNTPGGSIDVGSETYALRIEGELKESDKLKDIIVSNYGGNVVYLKDIAHVSDTVEEKAQETYVNGNRGATIVIQKQSGANSVEIVNQIRAKLPELQKNLPKDVVLNEINNTTDNIVNSIASLTDTVLLALLFVVLVVLFFLGQWKATIIIAITIPISLIAAFIYLFVSGNSINVVSLSAISIAIGMVVDDAIVVLENITTQVDRGARPREAAIYGTNEVSVAVVATTLTLLAVFFPFTMMTGMAGLMFKQLGWMVCIIMIVSTVAALTLTPMMSSLLLTPKRKYKTKSERAYQPIARLLDRLDIFYERTLKVAVRRKWMTLLIGIAIFLSSVILATQIGSEFFPASDNGQISGTIELPIGANVDRARDVYQRFEAKIKKDFPEIESTTFTIGALSDDSDNSWAAMQTNASNIISMNIRLSDFEKRDRDIFEIAELMRKEISTYTEVDKFNIIAGGNGGMTSGSTVDVEIYGYDFLVTENIAKEVQTKMASIKGFRDVQISREDYKPQFRVVFDRDKLALNGLNVATASQYVRNRMNGMTASFFREDGEEYLIKVRYAKAFRQSIEDIENIQIMNPMGRSVKLVEVARVEENFAPPQIERQNRERIVKVSASLYGETLDKATANLKKELDKMDVPLNIGMEIGGTIVEQQESFGEMAILLLLIIMLVYIVMAAQFESLSYPFIIMLSILFAFTGMFVALFITGQTLNMMSYIGGIMLVGIVVKNGIVLVDYINLNRERGMGIKEAVISGGKSRLRPVLMTTATTVLGMIPMALGIGEGAELWQTMGISIVGGLTFSTLITLLIVPVTYVMIAARQEKKKKKRKDREFARIMRAE